jgi:hypothetical protein
MIRAGRRRRLFNTPGCACPEPRTGRGRAAGRARVSPAPRCAARTEPRLPGHPRAIRTRRAAGKDGPGQHRLFATPASRSRIESKRPPAAQRKRDESWRVSVDDSSPRRARPFRRHFCLEKRRGGFATGRGTRPAASVSRRSAARRPKATCVKPHVFRGFPRGAAKRGTTGAIEGRAPRRQPLGLSPTVCLPDDQAETRKRHNTPIPGRPSGFGKGSGPCPIRTRSHSPSRSRPSAT